MGNKLYEENSVQAIANAIRSKLGVETTYKINEMASAIGSIVKPNGTTNITENGYHNVTAYEQAYVQVPGSVPTGTVNIVENGDYDVGQYAEAHVAVPQPVGKKIITQNGTDIDIVQYALADVTVQPNVDSKTINQNGVYNASSDNLDGYSQVTVDVPPPAYIKIPIEFDYTNGYVDTNGIWTYQYPSNNYLDIYRVENGKSYKLMFGAVTGNRARGCLTTTDVRTLPEGSTVSGTFIGTNATTIVPGTWYPFTSAIDGYLIIQKCNDQQADIQTYLFCVEDM